MASKEPHQMSYPEFIEWATPKVRTVAGREEVRKALVSLVGWARSTPDQQAAQQAIKMLGSQDFNHTTIKQLEELSTQVTEQATQKEQEQVATDTTKARDIELMRGIATTPWLKSTTKLLIASASHSTRASR